MDKPAAAVCAVCTCTVHSSHSQPSSPKLLSWLIQVGASGHHGLWASWKNRAPCRPGSTGPCSTTCGSHTLASCPVIWAQPFLMHQGMAGVPRPAPHVHWAGQLFTYSWARMRSSAGNPGCCPGGQGTFTGVLPAGPRFLLTHAPWRLARGTLKLSPPGSESGRGCTPAL